MRLAPLLKSLLLFSLWSCSADVAWACGVPGALQDMPAAEEAVEQEAAQKIRCVRVRLIRSFAVLDDRHIHLAMATGPDLLVTLRNSCPQLKFDNYFHYRVSGLTLCARTDTIRTRSGFSCQIESFSVFQNDQDSSAQDAPEASEKQ